MGNLALAYQSAIDGVVSWYGDEDGAFPKTNLSNPVLSKPWRYTPAASNDGAYARLVYSTAPYRTNHIALINHNLSQNAQIRVRAGTARLNLDFTQENPMVDMVTFGGGANGTRVDEFGTMVTGGAPRFHHDRRYPNNGFLNSDDLTSFVAYGGGVKYADNQTVDMPNAGATIRQAVTRLYVDTYEIRAQVRLVSGDGTICGYVAGSGFGTALSAQVVVPKEWTWVTVTVAPTGNPIGNGQAGFQKVGASGVLKFRKLQFCRGSSGGRYFKTTTKKRFRCIGILVETQATNSVIRSIEYDNAVWAKTVTVTPNTQTGPDGTNTMDSLNATAINQTISQDFTRAGTTTQNFSMQFKDTGTATSVSMQILWMTGGTTQSVTCTFNPSTGAFISSTNSGATLGLVGVKDEGEGFFRAYLLGTGNDALNTVVRFNLLWNTTGTLIAGHSQDGFTTVIPTAATAVTRTVDTAVIEPTTWVPYIWNPLEGTLYHEAMADDIPTWGVNNQSIVSFRDAGATNVFESRMISIGAGTPSMTTRNTVAGTIIFAPVAVNGSVNVPMRQAVRYRAGDWQNAIDGSLRSSDPDAVPTGITTINLMLSPGANSALLRRVVYWPAGKTNAELIALSATGPGAVDYDSGWSEVVKMGTQGDLPATWGSDFDIIKTFPIRTVEWMRIDIFDPSKTSGTVPFSIGRLFSGTNIFQPAANADYGLENRWRDNTTFSRARDGRAFYNQGTRDRESAFSFVQLTHTEGAALHELQGTQGISGEVIYLPDPDDEAECQRYGMVGTLKELDPISYPQYANRAGAGQVEKRR